MVTDAAIAGYLVRDLFFEVRVTEALKRTGVTARRVSDRVAPEGFQGLGLVIVDLSVAQDRWLPAIEAAHRAGVPVLAFGSHMAQEQWRVARAAGADRIVANSQVVEHLPELVRRLLTQSA